MRQSSDETALPRRKLLVNLGSGPKRLSRLPAVLAACAAKLPSVKPVVLFDFCVDGGYRSTGNIKLAIELLGSKKQDADRLLQILALVALIEDATDSEYESWKISQRARRATAANAEAVS